MPGPHRFERPGLRKIDALADGLQRLGRQVITYDPPGSGRSTRPARLSTEEMHQYATQALQACGIPGPVDGVGHSMAGLVMLAYALEQPRRVRRLVLIGTGSGGPAYMHAPGALWNRSHPHFRALAPLGVLHLAWPNLATERLVNNLIERESFHDQRLARPAAVRPEDWLRRRQGRGLAPAGPEAGLRPAVRRAWGAGLGVVRPPRPAVPAGLLRAAGDGGGSMVNVLMAHATKNGSTQQVAEAITAALRRQARTSRLCPRGQCGNRWPGTTWSCWGRRCIRGVATATHSGSSSGIVASSRPCRSPCSAWGRVRTPRRPGSGPVLSLTGRWPGAAG